jgi:hypothetical protein
MRFHDLCTTRTLTIARRAAIFLTVGLAGCASARLRPASSAHVIPDVPNAAVAEDSGIRIAAEANDWNAAPADLPERLTPLKVRIINHSGEPIQILYQQFTLVGGHGHKYQPLPPAPIAEDAHVPPVRPLYAATKFFVAPRLHGVYPSLETWSAPLARDDDFYAQQMSRWEQDLPTHPMRRMALPEGVLADGGEISGFLYFENATRKEKHVTFHADLDAPPQGDQVTQIEIPFVVK